MATSSSRFGPGATKKSRHGPGQPARQTRAFEIADSSIRFGPGATKKAGMDMFEMAASSIRFGPGATKKAGMDMFEMAASSVRFGPFGPRATKKVGRDMAKLGAKRVAVVTDATVDKLHSRHPLPTSKLNLPTSKLNEAIDTDDIVRRIESLTEDSQVTLGQIEQLTKDRQDMLDQIEQLTEKLSANHPLRWTEQLTTSQSNSQPLDRIGSGSCGSVWVDSSLYPNIDDYNTDSAAYLPVPPALKLWDGPSSKKLQINKEAIMYRHIMSRIRDTRPWVDQVFGDSFRVNIPRYVKCLNDGPDDRKLWDKIIPRIPHMSKPSRALISERILPLSLPVRRMLVIKAEVARNKATAKYIPCRRFPCAYCPKPETIDPARQRLVDDKGNEPFLVRPYLGQKIQNTPKGFWGSPGNVFLYIDLMEELGLDGKEYARAMADGLAFMLWVCETNAAGVDFVIARPRPVANTGKDLSVGTKTFTASGKEGILGEHEMWILDFDCCKRIFMTPEGVEEAVENFWGKDPYYPNPKTAKKDERDAVLWKVFKERFLETSEKVMRLKCDSKFGKEQESPQEPLPEESQQARKVLMSLPELFIKRVEETAEDSSGGISM